MKRDKVFNAVFCGIIGGVCLYIPVHFMLVHVGVVTKTSNDNQVAFEPVAEKNIVDKLSNRLASSHRIRIRKRRRKYNEQAP